MGIRVPNSSTKSNKSENTGRFGLQGKYFFFRKYTCFREHSETYSQTSIHQWRLVTRGCGLWRVLLTVVVSLGQRAGENSSEAYVCSDIRFRQPRNLQCQPRKTSFKRDPLLIGYNNTLSDCLLLSPLFMTNRQGSASVPWPRPRMSFASHNWKRAGKEKMLWLDASNGYCSCFVYPWFIARQTWEELRTSRCLTKLPLPTDGYDAL